MNKKRLSVLLTTALIVLSTSVPVFADTKSPAKTTTATLIQVNNEIGTTCDSVVVSGLSAGDVVKLYSASVGNTLLTSATVATGATSVKVSTDKLVATGGTIYLTITKSGSTTEGKRVAVKYDSEKVTKPVSKSLVKITNNAGTTNDTISVSGLVAGDVVKVYSSEKSTTVIATATVASDAKSATIKTNQLKTSGGVLFISVTNVNKTESKKVAVNYISESGTNNKDGKKKTTPLVTVTNKAGTTKDTIAVSGLLSGDVVKVYSTADATTAIATATVAAGATSVKITTDKLLAAGGTIYVGVTSNGSTTESSRITVKYNSETPSKPILKKSVKITNGTGTTNDTIAVSGLTAGDVIKVYSTANGTTAIATATVATGATSVTINTDKLVAKGGVVFVTVTNTNKAESSKVAVNYAAESRTSTDKDKKR